MTEENSILFQKVSAHLHVLYPDEDQPALAKKCFEVMDLKGGRKAPFNRGVGVIVETEKGRFVGGRGGGTFTGHDGKTESFRRDETQGNQDGTVAHMTNFVQAVHDGNISGLRAW